MKEKATPNAPKGEQVQKPVKETKPKAVKSTVKLLNYTIKAVIPTGPYANIQPEISVSASSIEEANAYVIPHVDELFEKYLNISDRPKPRVTVTSNIPTAPKPAEVPKEVPAPIVTEPTPTTPPSIAEEPKVILSPESVEPATPLDPAKQVTPPLLVETPAPVPTGQETMPSSAFGRAKMAIESCKTLEAISLIEQRVEASQNLDALDKVDLEALIKEKRKELSF